jgi:hypothetical protein
MDLSPGADLWFCAEFSQSAKARQLDWYLGFQLVRTEARLREAASRPLMVACSDLLPTQAVVVLPTADRTAAAWVDEVFEIAVKMRAQSVRLFWPETWVQPAGSTLARSIKISST